MSYAVLHMKKIKMNGIRGIQNHNERLKESKTNMDINYSKSHLNMDLIESDNRTYYMRIKDRISELNLSKAVRKDAVVVCGFICTSDKAFFDELTQKEKDKFFKESHNFLKERYGERNVIASKVHYDETTPHLHCYIMPVTKDGRLSAKSIFTPKELRDLQTEYHMCMRGRGFALERGLEGSNNKHIETNRFKLKTACTELNDVSKSLYRLKTEYISLSKKYMEIKPEFDNYIKTLSSKDELHEKLDPYKDKLKNILSPYKLEFENKVAENLVNKVLDTALKDKIILEKEKLVELEKFIDSFINVYHRNFEIIKNTNMILKKYKQVEKDNSNLTVKAYDDDRTIKNLKTENKDLKSKVDVLNKLERTFNILEKYLKKTDQIDEVNKFIDQERKIINRSRGFDR